MTAAETDPLKIDFFSKLRIILKNMRERRNHGKFNILGNKLTDIYTSSETSSSAEEQLIRGNS